MAKDTMSRAEARALFERGKADPGVVNAFLDPRNPYHAVVRQAHADVVYWMERHPMLEDGSPMPVRDLPHVQAMLGDGRLTAGELDAITVREIAVRDLARFEAGVVAEKAHPVLNKVDPRHEAATREWRALRAAAGVDDDAPTEEALPTEVAPVQGESGPAIAAAPAAPAADAKARLKTYEAAMVADKQHPVWHRADDRHRSAMDEWQGLRTAAGANAEPTDNSTGETT